MFPKKKVLELAREVGEALTFGDVRLRPGYSEVMPEGMDIGSRFSRNVGLKVPLVSAAMDTVTEAELSIELAKLGGLGVIHRSLSLEEQAQHVSMVKRHLNGRIEEPVCVNEGDSVESVLKRGYGFRSFPVLSGDGKLVGIVTGSDFDFCNDPSKKVRDIMSDAGLRGDSGTSLDEAYRVMVRNKKKFLPLVDDSGRVKGMYAFRDVKRIKGGNPEGYNVDSNERLVVGAAIGTGEEELRRAEALRDAGADVLVIDTAHGDSKPVYDILKALKDDRSFDSLDVVAGNVSIGESAKRLADAGADGIKVGQGPGSICTTRVVAGIGRPQVSAVYGCVRELKGIDVPICADGGIENSGDIPIAIAAGAESVMMGSVFAGTEESPGKVVYAGGAGFKDYRGMGSRSAMEDSEASRTRYLQADGRTLVPEGVESRVPFKGRLRGVLDQMVGGLKKGMGYVGAGSIKELRVKGDFDRITNSGLAESRPHGVNVQEYHPRSGS